MEEKIYYVIVDLDSLTYMRNGYSTSIIKADKFDSLEIAKKELKEKYDDNINGAIYRVFERTLREIQKAE